MTLLAPIPLPERLADAEAAERLFAPLAKEAVEVVVFVYLDAERRVLGMRQSRSLAHDTHEVPVREVAIDALAWDAAGVVMAHNHPSGDPTPSRADRDATRRIVRALEPLGVRLLDHLIVARGGATSFRSLGLL
ncbi:JAB domain-containing protein [Sphingomonas sp. LB-2]|uniref:JAB domain-containing protein n=1 Tax=Sphingomonas caeni TaxID=2984949 RepID=UPI002232570A|nr:JAB domain-containing protein [Sphingomonas caeni]MCW3847097.1 JAB domain-containing protein [Sphingomonas caeni]